MKKRIFLGAGALILLAAGAFADRATLKYGRAFNLYYKSFVGTCSFIESNISFAFTTTPTGTHQAAISTSLSIYSAYLFATSTCVKKVYFEP